MAVATVKVVELTAWQIKVRYFEIGLLIATVAAAIWAACAATSAVGVARETAKRELRAYVYIYGGHITINADRDRVRVFIQMKNFGQTPGYEFSTWLGGGAYLFEASPFPEFTAGLSDRTNASIIGPGQTADIDTDATVINLPTVEAIIDENLGFFVWGGAYYQDAFERNWAFMFRIRIGGEAANLVDGSLLTGPQERCQWQC